jgi:hypothetical protein
MTTSGRRMRRGGDTVNHKDSEKINTGDNQLSRNCDSTDNGTVLGGISKEIRQRVTDLGYIYR